MQFDRWMHTAVILCQHANVNRGKDQRPFEVWDFHPYWKGPKRTGLKLNQDNIVDLKPLFENSITITASEGAASIGEADVASVIAARPKSEPLFRKSMTITVREAKQSMEGG